METRGKTQVSRRENELQWTMMRVVMSKTYETSNPTTSAYQPNYIIHTEC